MLVLTRKKHETITMIATKDIPAGTEIVVAVSDIREWKVKLGIDAPKCVNIVRTELLKPMTQQEMIDETLTRR
jgi:carbon storage regulator CsrA